MTISFNDRLGCNNALGARLLAYIGHVKSPNDVVYTHGEMPIEKARAGIEQARGIVPEEDREYLEHLDAVVRDIEAQGGKLLTWW